MLAASAEARTFAMQIEHLAAPEIEASGVDLRVNDASPATLRLAIDRVDVPSLALSGRVEWQCTLTPEAAGRSQSCNGPVRLRGAGEDETATLGIRLADDRVELSLAKDAARVRIGLPLRGAGAREVAVEHVPAAWLRAPLAHFWSNGELREGLVGGDIALAADGAVDGNFALTQATFNTNDGAFAGEHVDASGRLRIEGPSAELHVVGDAALRGGKIRLGDVRFELPPTPVALDVDARAVGDEWRIERFGWRDAGTLEFSAGATLAPGATDALRRLDVEIGRAALPAAMDRYAKSLLAGRDLATWTAKGALSGAFSIEGVVPSHVALEFEKLDLADGARFAVRGLDGGIDWSAEGERPATTLRWDSLNADTFALAGANAKVRSRGGMIELAQPLTLALARGKLALDRLSFDPRITKGLDAHADFTLRDLGYDSADGTIAAAGVEAKGTLRLAGTMNAPEIALTAAFEHGELLYGPFYVKLPAAPVHAALDAALGGGRWRVAKIEWNDPGVLEIAGSADVATSGVLSAIDLDVQRAALAPALDRYARSWLASKGYPAFAASGEISGALAYGADGLRQLRLEARNVDLDDGAGRFRIAGLDGGIDWGDGESAPGTTLGWNAIELFRIPLDAARLSLATRDDAIALAAPASIGVLGGALKLEKLSYEPRSPRGERYAGSFAIAGIDMARLCTALGWPRFGGNFSGGIPEIELAGDTIALHGGLDLWVFDGHLGVSGLTLERPFGVAPSLHADIHFESFDLEQLTSAFSFGGMSGRLDGTIEGLRLVDWSPVAFDAALRADGGGRMSYKAVDDLTALGGGGGLSSSLQTMALKIFDTFGYRRLGIRCKLAAEVCAMGGIEPAGAADSAADSYTIVEGSGLPRIDIIGHRRRVAWPTLVERLIEATEGQGPVIE